MNKDPAVTVRRVYEVFYIRDGLTVNQMQYLKKYINNGMVVVTYSFAQSRARRYENVNRVFEIGVDPAVGERTLTAIRLLLSENLL
jgi:hypothetical protein